jgi:ABC-2 type transport system permease protein
VNSLATQVGFVARRSLKRTLRQPALIVPTITFPLLLLALNSAGLAGATKIRGFPTDSYLDFGLTVTFMQAGLFAATTAGTELATDIETGFINRLQLTPLRRVSILAGELAGALAVAFLGAASFITVGLIADVSFQAGPAGLLVLLALAQLTAMGFAGLGAVMAARTGSAEAVQGLFPLLFVTFFLSSLNLPRPLIQTDWFRTVATWNPVSYMIEGMRSLIISGWDGSALWKGFLAAGLIAGLSLFGASRALRTRLART